MTSEFHRLFFALRPDDVVLAAIERAAERLKAMQRVRGRWLHPAKLHMTVQFLGDFAGTDEIEQQATEAAATLRVMPFGFTLDHAASFPRRFNSPCVLRCAAESEAPLQALSRELATALNAAGLGEHLETRPYVPHLTLAYTDSALPGRIAIEPIVWRVSDICLMDSHAGQHTPIGAWPLRA